MSAPSLSAGQRQLLKLLIHFSALLWLVALGVALRWIWLERIDAVNLLLVTFAPLVFLVYVTRRVYLPNGAFPEDWSGPERAARCAGGLGT